MKAPVLKRVRRLLAIASLTASPCFLHAATQTNWVAFNDHRPTVGVTHDNATGYDTLATGDGGPLRDFNSGEELPVLLEVTAVGTPDDFGANAYPDEGTPAYNLFNGIVDLGNEGLPGMRTSTGSSVQYTFRNLDPTARYHVYGTVSRGNNYPDRWSVHTLQGAESAVDAHVNGSTDTNIFTKATFPSSTLTNMQVALNSGENRVGSLVGWRNIAPGPDGSFSILNEHYVGPTPFGNASAGPYGYGLNALYLVEEGEIYPIRITGQPAFATNAPGQTATFTVTVEGTGATYQWQRSEPGTDTFADIPDATSASYTTGPLAVSDDATRYRVLVSVPEVTLTSRPATLSVQGAPIEVPGLLQMDIYKFITGTAVVDLQSSPKFPADPDETVYLSGFDTRTAFPNDNNNNYGARITGFIIPPESGNYEFFLRSDDSSELAVSTDDDPVNLQTLAFEDTCCGPFEEPGFPETSGPIPLVEGRKYAVQALLKEGTGGDLLQVAWRREGDTNAPATLLPIPAAFVSITLPAQGEIAITRQPASVTNAQNSIVEFSVEASSLRSPLLVQWQRNGVTVPGLTGGTISYGPLSPSDNNAEFKALISVPGATLLSSGAALVVTNDSTAPTIVSARADETMRAITVKFSEAVSPATASVAGNYTVDKGLAITSVQMIDAATVRLETGNQEAGTSYMLTVQNVQDTAANSLQSVTLPFTSYARLTGGLKFEAYRDLTGTVIDDLKNAAKYPGSPDLVGYLTSFDTRGIHPDDSMDNYGARITGWVVPAETADYIFFLRSDDAGELWLSTDETEENLVLIAEETDCCEPFMEPDTGDFATSLPISLVEGRRYYVQALYKEGTGGDYAQVAWRKTTDTTPAGTLQPIPGSALEVIALPGTVTPPVVQFTSPQNDVVLPTGSVVELVATASAAEGKSVAKVEFFRGNIKLGEATEPPYSILVSNLVDDVYAFTARVTDSAGLLTTTAPLQISLGERREIRVLVTIDASHIWRFNREGLDLGTDWVNTNYNDSSWQQGAALIADETGATVEPIRTLISRLTDAGDYIKTMYFRYKFNWTGPTNGVRLALRHVVDDGAVVYLNGIEVHRFGIAAGPVTYLTDATSHEQAYAGPYDVQPTALGEGENILAVEVHQQGDSSSDIVFGAELVATVPVEGPGGDEPRFIRTERAPGGLALEWTPGGILQSRTSLSTGEWADVPRAQSPYSAPFEGTSRFFRLRR